MLMSPIRRVVLASLIFGIMADVYVRIMPTISSILNIGTVSDSPGTILYFIAHGAKYFLLALFPLACAGSFYARTQGEPESEAWAIFFLGVIAGIYGFAVAHAI